LGKRLGPLTQAMPKPMLPVGDKPFLQLLMEHFAGLGFTRFVLAVSYRWEVIRDHFGDGRRFGWEVQYSVEDQPLGTGGAVLLAQRLWGQAALVANGDTFLAEDWRELLATHRRQNLPATIALIRQDDCARFGTVEVQDGRVARFLEKHAAAGPGWINAGVYVITQAALAGREPGSVFSLETDVFPRLRDRMAVHYCSRAFADIGTVESLEEFRRRKAES
jgi:NDP-sugar pyrophosphorylase family protein